MVREAYIKNTVVSGWAPTLCRATLLTCVGGVTLPQDYWGRVPLVTIGRLSTLQFLGCCFFFFHTGLTDRLFILQLVECCLVNSSWDFALFGIESNHVTHKLMFDQWLNHWATVTLQRNFTLLETINQKSRPISSKIRPNIGQDE